MRALSLDSQDVRNGASMARRGRGRDRSIHNTSQPRVRNWLFAFAFVVAFLIVFGGFVRLTRSGLSIVEWNPVSGTVPPIGEAAWQSEFAKYQQTPEFQHVNSTMTLEEYKYIFYIEWLHRLIARFAGLFYAVPLFYFLGRRMIPLREAPAYVVGGLLFLGQAFAGWYMVSSGLIDRPSVSHFRLTIHLLLALALLALALWLALDHHYGRAPRRIPTKLSRYAGAALVVLILQISYGGLTAGLKAGLLADTWPLLVGALVPPGVLTRPGDLLLSPVTILFIHRWLAFAGLILAPLLYWYARSRSYSPEIQRGLAGLAIVVVLQLLLGILTVVRHVEITVALAHQANAVLLVALSVFTLHRLGAPGARTSAST